MYNEIGGVERVIQLLTSGGLGDAAMSFAKADALNIPKDQFVITHARIRQDSLDKPILDFYRSQGVRASIMRLINNCTKTHDGDYLDRSMRNSVSEYDYYLGTHWSADNGSDMSSWEISPFPIIKYNEVVGWKDNLVLLNPSSGGVDKVKKSFSRDMVHKFFDKFPNTVIIGNGSEKEYGDFPNSLYNKTSIAELVNLIASSDVVITPEGFTAYFAGMCGRKVFVKGENISAINNRKHPNWNMEIVQDLNEVEYDYIKQ